MNTKQMQMRLTLTGEDQTPVFAGNMTVSNFQKNFILKKTELAKLPTDSINIII